MSKYLVFPMSACFAEGRELFGLLKLGDKEIVTELRKLHKIFLQLLEVAPHAHKVSVLSFPHGYIEVLPPALKKNKELEATLDAGDYIVCDASLVEGWEDTGGLCAGILSVMGDSDPLFMYSIQEKHFSPSTYESHRLPLNKILEM